jgi:hypothetical protein
MKTFLSKNIIILIIITILINSILFYFAGKIEANDTLKGLELFFSIYILIIIIIGLNIRRKKDKTKVNLNHTLFLLANGIIIYSIYITKLFVNEFTLNLRYSLTLLIGLISILLLFKIHFDLLNNKNVA